MEKFKKKNLSCFLIGTTFLVLTSFCLVFAEEEVEVQAPQPVEVNGDILEFFTEEQKIVAEGNIVIDYGDINLTCDKITVYTQTKDAFADGNVKLISPQGILNSNSLVFNFDTKEGKFIDADFKSDPYFGFSSEIDKKPTKFILKKGYITTCNLDMPHYRIYGRNIEVTPGDKIEARGATFIVGNAPLMHTPYFRQSLKDKKYYFDITPGQSKEWGRFLLTEFRYWLFDDKVWGRIHYDWREYKGFGGGIGLQHNFFGSGDFDYYRVHEHLRYRGEVEPFRDSPRYKLEYRHKWDIDEKTDFILELHRFSDIDFLKQYFYRQYEKESQPKTYLLWSHAFDNATLSLEMRSRMNQFYSETEKMPEVKISTSSFEIGESKLYFSNSSSFAALNSMTADSDQDDDAMRFDTYTKLTRPLKFFYIEFNPFIAERFTFYSKDNSGKEHLKRNIFYSGMDISTKFSRVYETKFNSYGLDIDRLRHIITPSVEFEYIHDPTLQSSRLTSFDELDSITKQNNMKLSLQNKLQTKRDGENVDFLNFIVDSTYNFKLEGHGGRFSDINLDLEMLPNSWVEFESQATFDLRERNFSSARFDVSFIFNREKDEKLSAGYQYARDSDSDLITIGFDKRLGPKWKFRCYQRFNIATLQMEEQEYGFVRDLHCWEVEFSVSNRRKKGVMFWWVFRIKAFPDVGFEVDKGHKQPKN